MESLVQLAHALADETRLRILTFLLTGEATLNDVVTRLHLPQSWAVTQLALLRQAGLVSLNTAGQQRVYRTDVARVQALLKALQALAPAPPPRRATTHARCAAPRPCARRVRVTITWPEL